MPVRSLLVAAALAARVAVPGAVPTDELGAFSAVTWNVQQPSGRTLSEQAEFLGGTGADLIALQEVYRGSIDRWRAELLASSKRQWQARYAPAVRRFDGNRGAGIAIFSALPIVESDSLLMASADRWASSRPALRVRVALRDTAVDVFTAHLSSGEQAGVSRAQQLHELASWIGGGTTRWALGGDLNAEPLELERVRLPATPWYVPGRPDHATWPAKRPARRLDYWVVSSRDPALDPADVSVLDVCRGRAKCLSDHRPVLASFAAIR